MTDTIKYRIDGGIMLIKHNEVVIELVGFFNDEPQAHATIKELSAGDAEIAKQYYLVKAERLLPVELSDKPL
jgi:hypothetical protein